MARSSIQISVLLSSLVMASPVRMSLSVVVVGTLNWLGGLPSFQVTNSIRAMWVVSVVGTTVGGQVSLVVVSLCVFSLVVWSGNAVRNLTSLRTPLRGVRDVGTIARFWSVARRGRCVVEPSHCFPLFLVVFGVFRSTFLFVPHPGRNVCRFRNRRFLRYPSHRISCMLRKVLVGFLDGCWSYCES